MTLISRLEVNSRNITANITETRSDETPVSGRGVSPEEKPDVIRELFLNFQ
jgi:hypothetical protein